MRKIRPAWLTLHRGLTLTSIAVVFAPILFGSLSLQEVGAADHPATHRQLQLFEILALAVAVWRATMPGTASRFPLWATGLWLALFTVLMMLFHSPPFVEAAGLLGVVLYLWFWRGKVDNPRAAAAVLFAVACQAFFVPLLFNRLAPALLPLDARAAGTVLGLIQPGASVQGATITGASGLVATVTEACCSIHNLSLGLMCWVAITMMRRPVWRPADVLIGVIAGGSQATCNILRIVLVAFSPSMYETWHQGAGKYVIAAATTLLAVLVSYYGADWAERGFGGRTPTRSPARPAPLQIATEPAALEA